jgi:UDP-glucose 4-epimerase
VVTGCAGFVGSHLVDALLDKGLKVIGIDDFSAGHRAHLSKALTNANFQLLSFSLLNSQALKQALQGVEAVFHLAANADVRFGLNHPRKDLEQNTIASFNLLEAMRLNDVSRLVFTSTGAIYGNASVIPTPEDAPFPIQTSLYGASKLACEGMMQAYAEGYGFDITIFRPVAMMGERYGHGHVYDFCKKLLQNPHELSVLGNGNQKKSYLYIKDAVSAMLLAFEKSLAGLHIFNLGRDDVLTVKESLALILENLQLSPRVAFEDKNEGWVGDSPHILLACDRLKTMGWKPVLDYPAMVGKTVQYLLDNRWIFQ